MTFTKILKTENLNGNRKCNNKNVLLTVNPVQAFRRLSVQSGGRGGSRTPTLHNFLSFNLNLMKLSAINYWCMLYLSFYDVLHFSVMTSIRSQLYFSSCFQYIFAVTRYSRWIHSLKNLLTLLRYDSSLWQFILQLNWYMT